LHIHHRMVKIPGLRIVIIDRIGYEIHAPVLAERNARPIWRDLPGLTSGVNAVFSPA
jgi:hypothetical protein